MRETDRQTERKREGWGDRQTEGERQTDRKKKGWETDRG